MNFQYNAQQIAVAQHQFNAQTLQAPTNLYDNSMSRQVNSPCQSCSAHKDLKLQNSGIVLLDFNGVFQDQKEKRAEGVPSRGHQRKGAQSILYQNVTSQHGEYQNQIQKTQQLLCFQTSVHPSALDVISKLLETWSRSLQIIYSDKKLTKCQGNNQQLTLNSSNLGSVLF